MLFNIGKYITRTFAGRAIPAAIFFFSLCFTVFSQEDNSVFIINSFNFNINGITRPSALIKNGELIEGEELTGSLELEKYIQEKTQLLYNERVLDSVSIDYSIGALREDGKYPVDLFINIKDTWNIVAIPRPKYSSNTGFELILKARDYNFLGTMMPLRIDIGYIFDEEGRHSFVFGLDSHIPFNALGLDWYFKFVTLFDYRHDTEAPFFFKNTAGIAVELPVLDTTVTVGFDESVVVNEENEYFDKPIYGDFQEGLYLTSNPHITWRIPTGFDTGELGEIIYSPRFSVLFYHEFPQWPLDNIRKGPVLELRHNLRLNRIDWIGNFRKGLDFNINNSFDYNVYKPKYDEFPWTGYLTFSGLGHFIVTDFFGISANLKYRHWFFYDQGYTKAGDVLRGILDREFGADYMLSLNLDFPFRVLRFSPPEWKNNNILQIFLFDLHLSPIIDTAVYHSPVENASFDINNFLVTGGFELFIFPEFFRSLYLRASMGWDLINFSNGRNYELYIGTDFHY